MAEKDIKKVKSKEDKDLAVKKVNKKTTTEKKEVAEKKDTIAEKTKKNTTKETTPTKKSVKTKKISTEKKATKSKKADTKKTATSKKEPVKRTTASKSSEKEVVKTSTAISKKTSSRKKSIKTTAKQMLAEYYDLPYRYNETTVKILAQTPTTLFVYWDISDDDRQALINEHGENMFYETKPILIIHNTTNNYSFEVEINDFANSWYIRTQEPDCNYIIELGRRPINNPNEYIYIRSSNNIMSPNNHILFEKANLGNILFRNIKTNVLSSKDFGNLRFINDIDKLYGNVYDVYSRLYKDETLDELTMPSSGEFINK